MSFYENGTKLALSSLGLEQLERLKPLLARAAMGAGAGAASGSVIDSEDRGRGALLGGIGGLGASALGARGLRNTGLSQAAQSGLAPAIGGIGGGAIAGGARFMRGNEG